MGLVSENGAHGYLVFNELEFSISTNMQRLKLMQEDSERIRTAPSWLMQLLSLTKNQFRYSIKVRQKSTPIKRHYTDAHAK